MVHHLWPVFGDVVQVFGVNGDLLAERPGTLELSQQALCRGLLAAVLADESCFLADPMNGVRRVMKLILGLQALSAPARMFFLESSDQCFLLRRELVGAVMRCP